MGPKGGLFLIAVLTGCAAYQAAGAGQSGRQALLINKPEDALGYFQQVAQSNPNYIFQSGLYREGIWTYVGRSQYFSADYRRPANLSKKPYRWIKTIISLES